MKAKRILSAVVAFIMTLALVPSIRFTSGAEVTWTVPDGYAENEYNQLAAFLEIEDEDGVKNGTKLNEDYDVNNPGTWGDGWIFMPFEEPYHVMFITFRDVSIVGEIDVSNFPELYSLYLSNNSITKVNASNCPELGDVELYATNAQEADFSNCESIGFLICNDNQLTSLNVSGCTGITTGIHCDDNQLTELDVSDCTQMATLVCDNNLLTNLNVSNCAEMTTLNAQNNNLSKIDLSDCVNLEVLNLSGNKFKTIDMSALPNMIVDHVKAKGEGVVGYWQTMQGSNKLIVLYAYPNEGRTFYGWYNGDDELLSTEAEWNASSVEDLPADIYARFIPPVTLRGDADCSGTVNAVDALLTMRYAMSLVSYETLGDQGFSNANMNEDDSVNATDAVLIMRYILNNQ